MSYELVRTGKRIPFLKLQIGNPFFAHGKVWIRTSYEAATELTYSGCHSSTCNFTIDVEDEIVEIVNVVIDGVPVIDPSLF